MELATADTAECCRVYQLLHDPRATHLSVHPPRALKWIQHRFTQNKLLSRTIYILSRFFFRSLHVHNLTAFTSLRHYHLLFFLHMPRTSTDGSWINLPAYIYLCRSIYIIVSLSARLFHLLPSSLVIPFLFPFYHFLLHMCVSSSSPLVFVYRYPHLCRRNDYTYKAVLSRLRAR